MTALTAGWREARRVWDDPARATRDQSFEPHHARYSRLWAYYNNSMFDHLAHPWIHKYLADYMLFPRTRYLYNPVERLVDFYMGAIYPGVLSEDGKPLPDGVPIAIPFSKDTDPALKTAIAQFWQWSGWSDNMYRMIEEASVLGNTLIEIIDDVPRGKVTVDFIWPSFICDMSLDSAGNIKSYSAEYPSRDDEGYYTYRKEVDQQSFRYFRDGNPYDYTGVGAIVPNIYGFIPAVWVRHKTGQGYQGTSIINGSVPPIDELNSLVSHIHSQIRKVIEAPAVIWSDVAIDFANTNEETEASTDSNRDKEQSLNIFQGPTGGSVDSLVGNLDLTGADLSIARLYSEIEKRHPELTYYEQLRSMSQVTGPGAERLSGDVKLRVLRAQASYDKASKSLFRMAVAIAGMRANSGSWGSLNQLQQKFVPFNLDSFKNGALEIDIMPRPLIAPTRTEAAQEKQAFWTGIGIAVQNAGIPVEVALRDEGWSEDQLKQLGADKIAAIQRDQMLANEDAIPAVGQ